jgi:uncharacterized protein YsxB (DUF464 family)
VITVIVTYDECDVDNIYISGHANYAPKGYDIVCASVSLLAHMLVILPESTEDIYHIGLGLADQAIAHRVSYMLKKISTEYPNNVVYGERRN